MVLWYYSGHLFCADYDLFFEGALLEKSGGGALCVIFSLFMDSSHRQVLN